MLRSRARQALTMLDFPAPEGAATMNSVPRTGTSSLLNVLHLFADLVDQDLEFDGDVAGARVDGFRTQGIGFAVEFLQQEVQAPACGFRLAKHAPDLGDMAVEAVEFLVDVELLQHQ